MLSLNEINPVVPEKKTKSGKVYRYNNDGQRTNFDQKSSLEHSAQAGAKTVMDPNCDTISLYGPPMGSGDRNKARPINDEDVVHSSDSRDEDEDEAKDDLTEQENNQGIFADSSCVQWML